MKNKLTMIAGIFIWIGIGFVVWQFGVREKDDRIVNLSEALVEQATGNRQRVFMYMDERLEVGIGDPVFLDRGEGRFEQVGEVAAIPADIPLRFGASEKVTTGELLLYSKLGVIGSESRLTLHETPETLAWVLETMLPPAKRQELAQLLSSAFERHHEEIIAELQPIIESGLREAVLVVEEDLEDAVLARRDQFEEIGAKYQRDLVEQEIVPLVREEIFPIVRRYGEPLASEIGREIWDEASLWRFGWRYMYDLSPLPQRDLAKREFNRFVNSEAIPILEDHIDDFIEMQQDVFRDVSQNRAVQDVVRNSLRQIVEDQQVQRLMLEIVQEVFVENPRLKAVLRSHWSSPEARRALQIASQRLEPTAVEIGEMMFGSPELGITPEFSRVLRNQVLRKDRRWLVLHVDESSPNEASQHQLVLRVDQGAPSNVNPFAIVSGRQP